MNHVLGFAQLLEMDALNGSQAASVREILTSGGRLLQLIDRILAVSKTPSADLSFLDVLSAHESSLSLVGAYEAPNIKTECSHDHYEINERITCSEDPGESANGHSRAR
jgi:signal transduction histidine kinase